VFSQIRTKGTQRTPAAPPEHQVVRKDPGEQPLGMIGGQLRYDQGASIDLPNVAAHAGGGAEVTGSITVGRSLRTFTGRRMQGCHFGLVRFSRPRILEVDANGGPAMSVISFEQLDMDAWLERVS
jgi:hypothetical protein